MCISYSCTTSARLPFLLTTLLQGLGTKTLGTRAWCLHEMGTRSRARKEFYILKSLRPVNVVKERCCMDSSH